ncbi:MAG: hypothetical protein PVG39_09210 [Desulfobacteraceae bacterium]
MRRLILTGLIIITFINLGCSKDSSEEKTESTTVTAPETATETPKVTKTVLDTKDTMMAKLNEYKITVPEDVVFRSVDKQVYLDKDFEEKDTYLVYFDIKYQDQAKRDELLKWFNDQRQTLKDNGWVEKSYEKDDEMMGGGTSDRSVLVKESENCTLDIGITFNDTGSTIIIHPKYEIK